MTMPGKIVLVRYGDADEQRFKAVTAADLLPAVQQAFGAGLLKDAEGVGLTAGYGPLEDGATYRFCASAGPTAGPVNEDEVFTRWEAVKSPSQQNQQTVLQASPRPLVRNWRPSTNVALPPSLANAIFGTFSDALACTDLPSQADMDAALDLCTLASKYIHFEGDLEEDARLLLGTYLGTRLYKARVRPESRMQTDGCILANVSGLSDNAAQVLEWHLISVLEVKQGLGDGDSNFQGTLYYGVFWAARRLSEFLRHTCCPALLLELVGPHLRVSALYWSGDVVVRPLTPLLNLLLLADDEAHMVSVARVLAAVKSAVQALLRFYSQPPQPPAQAARHQGGRAWPYPLLAPSVAPCSYTEVAAVPDGRLVYTAVQWSSEQLSQPVLVRFSRRYSEQAHRTWAAHGLAPGLVSVQALPGGWLQIVMELLQLCEGWVELASVGRQAGDDVSAAVAAAQSALQRAHLVKDAEGRVFAHGDMRVQNIMVRRVAEGGTAAAGTAAAEYEVRFVDFEFAGAEGVASYPPYLSKAVAWPPGVEFGARVVQRHDTALLAASVAQLVLAAAGPLPPL